MLLYILQQFEKKNVNFYFYSDPDLVWRSVSAAD